DTPSIAAAEMAAAGQPVGATGVLGYFNPPFFALLMAPLSRLSLDDAYRVWTAASLGLMLVDALLLWWIARDLSRGSRCAFVLGFVTMFPLTYGLQIGQFSLILLPSWASAYLLLKSRHSAWAGVPLAPLLTKPDLLVPV